MTVTYELNAQGEQVKVTTTPTHVIRELVRPVVVNPSEKTKKQVDAEALIAKKNWVDADAQNALVLILQHLIIGE